MMSTLTPPLALSEDVLVDLKNLSTQFQNIGMILATLGGSVPASAWDECSDFDSMPGACHALFCSYPMRDRCPNCIEK